MYVIDTNIVFHTLGINSRHNIRRVLRVMRKATGIAVKRVFLNPFNIQLIEPKDYFFDSENRAERKHAKRKNATITKFGAPCKGIKPIRPSVQRRKNITA